MSRSGKLYDLQRIDSQLDQFDQRLKEIAAILADNKKVRLATAKYRKAKQALEEAQKELRSAENKVQDQRFKIKQNETKLYSGNIKNPKELQALQDEVKALKRFLGVLEDRQLDAMLQVDDMAEQEAAAQKVLDKINGDAARRQADLIAEQEKIGQNIATLEDKRLAGLNQVNAADVERYEDIRQKRAGVAVARVIDRACTACGATLSAALNQAASSFSELHHCETCGRILFGG